MYSYVEDFLAGTNSLSTGDHMCVICVENMSMPMPEGVADRYIFYLGIDTYSIPISAHHDDDANMPQITKCSTSASSF